MNEDQYLIPKRLVKKNTIFEGIGLAELGIVVMAFFIGLALFFVLKNINVVIGLIVLGLSTTIGIVLVIPFRYGENVLVVGKRFIKYGSSQQKFYYYRGTK